MGKLLGLDFGYKRIGIAISDSKKTIAFPYLCINVQKGNILLKLKKIINEHKCKIIILGLPLSLNGQETSMSMHVRQFAEKLKKETSLQVNLADERLSSYEAESILRNFKLSKRKMKNNLDSFSAKIILQNYMDQLNQKNN